MMNKMPELKPGMLVVSKDTCLSITRAVNNKDHVYGVAMWRNDHSFATSVQGTEIGVVIDDIYQIYDVATVSRVGINGGWCDDEEFISIESEYRLIWRRKATKEMTVAEISEKLGYPVKIVG